LIVVLWIGAIAGIGENKKLKAKVQELEANLGKEKTELVAEGRRLMKENEALHQKCNRYLLMVQDLKEGASFDPQKDYFVVTWERYDDEVRCQITKRPGAQVYGHIKEYHKLNAPWCITENFELLDLLKAIELPEERKAQILDPVKVFHPDKSQKDN
jgi:hypothetical protein